ncbi:MAG: type I-F CRISPR-associated helicase Cas3f [Lysobacterales bacterium]
MNVLLVSQCEKRALTETRRILDQFGERRGDRTWQTPITMDGLNTLRKLLRKTARKNTAVACHWIRGQNHRELLWVIGDASKFNAQGAVPTNTTTHDVLRRKDENDWHSAGVISLLARMAALWHDFGKASALFQDKLRPNAPFVADPYRHEWVSLRLFQAFVGDDDDAVWLARLQSLSREPDSTWLTRLQRDGVADTQPPFTNLPPLARTLGWLILTHHRLPWPASSTSAELQFDKLWKALDASWCSVRADATAAERSRCWSFKLGLPDASPKWRKAASDLAARMLKRLRSLNERDWLRDPFVAHLARAALMMADHQYSSQNADSSLGDPNYAAYANTGFDGRPKQRLDEHLIGVAGHARQVVRDLPQLPRIFGRLARHRAFAQRSTDDRFRWQDRAFDVAVALQRRSAEQGFFGVNMASTGCGKTLANGRIMYGLAHPLQGARFCVALGLRTLTLQTGDAYRDRLHLNDDDLAVMIGSSAVRALHEHARASDQLARDRGRGSSSARALIEDQTHVRYDGAPPQGAFGDWLKRGEAKLVNLLTAPVLVCTVDHLMPACEATRGGHQIAPILRLLTSDLVLDEPDDFDLDDLPALTRLVHFAGLFGSRVLLSSATLAPAIVQGLYAAYCAGRSDFQRNRGRPGAPVSICCAWFDEYKAVQSEHADEASFASAHAGFVDMRLKNIASKQEIRRRARIVPVDIATGDAALKKGFAKRILQSLCELHDAHHVVDPNSGKRVSIGLVRMANIDPQIDMARFLLADTAPDGTRIHLCVYHSRFPLLLRSNIERQLDRLLARHDEAVLFDDADLRSTLDSCVEPNQIFVVLASPVAEVGRDHDYDWAVIEPSSMRSIIQIAGRVRRHRPPSASTEANIILLDRNWRDVEGRGSGDVAFRHPGFESAQFRLNSHRLSELLLAEDYQPLTSAPRIAARATLKPENNLVDLEHERLRLLMLADDHWAGLNVRRWWESAVALTAAAQHKSPFRAGQQQETFVMYPDEDHAAGWSWRLLQDDGQLRAGGAGSRFDVKPIRYGQRIGLWLASDFLNALTLLADTQGLDLELAARRYGTIQLPATTGGSSGGTRQRSSGNATTWYYDHALGMRRNSG